MNLQAPAANELSIVEKHDGAIWRISIYHRMLYLVMIRKVQKWSRTNIHNWINIKT